jgi:PRTRC genetic system protein B
MLNDRTSALMTTYRPQVAVVVYQAKADQNDYYLESHSINEAGKLMEGKPLLQETVQGMVDAFFDERQNKANIKGLVPENLLSFDLLPGGNYKMVWYRPAEIRVIHFAAQLKLPTAKVWVPATLYMVSGKHFSVYALKGSSRPTEKTKIYRAPYHNVADSGSVCLGNAFVKKPADKTYSAFMKYWEDLFWLSEFTHLNGGKAVRSKDLDAVWRSLINSKTKKKWSDLDELIEMKNITLKKLL